MKKISIYMSMALAVLGMASCSQDRDPVLQTPTEFVLNTPVLADQFIELQEGKAIELVTSQPNYGYSAVANYSAEMSLTEDFSKAYALKATNATQARITIKQSDIATGICDLSGVSDEETMASVFPNGIPTMPVYFRAICELDGVEGSRIVSNVVSYNKILGYFAVPVPGYIYLVGAPEGWAGPTEGNATHYADWRLFEPKDAIGSGVYSGVFDIPAGEAMFRFYTDLTGWDNDSYGYQVPDEATNFDFVGNSFTSPVVKGKGAFNFPNWQGGKMTITVDMSDMKNITMTCTAGEAEVVVTKYIYLVGSISGWMEPGISNESSYKDYRLADRDGSGIYTGSWPAAKGHVNFRFCMELTEDGWDNDTQFGAAEPDGDVACTLTNGTYSGSYVNGKGNYAFDIENDATVNITVDTNNSTVTVNFE
ncbi:MAG: SusE domain-containing protein [Muribaculaceae bacterium]|nr:SusE domain-containing protein [Muribaculaceae bacterium]